MQKKKKGFTLVELLVVIAILAILAGVSVVGYLSFTKKAQESNDISLTTQMNTILQGEGTTEGKNKTAHDAVLDLQENGLDVTKLTPTREGYEFVYDLSQDKFFLLDGDKVVAPTNLTISTTKTDIYKFIGKDGTLSNEYSNYLKDDYIAAETLEISTGLDAGENLTVKSLKYDNKDNIVKDILIRTNSLQTTLEVDAYENGLSGNSYACDSIAHYGNLKEVILTNAGKNSYHEYGNLLRNINVQKGKVVIEEGAILSKVHINDNAADVSIEVKDDNQTLMISYRQVEKNNIVIDLPVSSNISVVERLENGDLVDAIDGNVYSVYIGSKGYASFEDAVTQSQEGETIFLAKDIDLTKYPVNTFKQINLENKTLDLMGHKISAQNAGVAYRGNNAIIKNGSFEGVNGASYALFVGDGPYSENMLLQDIVCIGGINVYNASVTIREMDFTNTNGKDYYALWGDNHSNITVEGGYFTSPSDKGGSVIHNAVTKPENQGLITIVGGIFEANGNVKLFGNGANVLIKGGTFNGDIPPQYVAQGYKVVTNSNGMKTVVKK